MKNDKQMLEMLARELKKSSESAKMPLRLQKESMVAMLKNDENKETDFSDKTGTKKSKTADFRKYAAAAAMFIMVLAGAISMITGTRLTPISAKMVKEDTFYSGYKGAKFVKPAKSIEELENVLNAAFKEDGTNAPERPVNPQKNEASGGEQTTVSEEKIIDQLYAGYQSAASAEKSVDETVGNLSAANMAMSGTDVVPAQSVDADIKKTNGEYLYIVTTGKNAQTGNMTEQIKIVKTVSAEEMKTVSSITLCDNAVAGAYEECIAIQLRNNILIAILGRKDFDSESKTTAIYYDITNPEKPEKIRVHTQDGKYLFSSFRGNSFCLVTDKNVNGSDFSVVPAFTVDGITTELVLEEIFISVKDPEASYIFITVTDISGFDSPVGCLAILGSGKQLYCTEGAITVAREFVAVESEEEASNGSLTEIHRFNVEGSSVAYSGTCVVKGSLIGGVSVNPKNDYMMIATASPESSNIYVFDKNMEFVSGLEEILPGKKIDAVKFIGKKGYLASEDETVIVSLLVPKFPKAAGVIPEKLFMGNLYEISDSKLLDVYTDENGKTTFRLFDVSDPENPSDAAKYVLERNYALPSSVDSRSVMIVSDKEMFGVPVVATDGENGTEFSAYMIFDVSEGKIEPVGLCRHENSYVGDAAVRAVYNNGTIYTVSGGKISAFSVNDCKRISQCEIR